jgi:hypothetical protein
MTKFLMPMVSKKTEITQTLCKTLKPALGRYHTEKNINSTYDAFYTR